MRAIEFNFGELEKELDAFRERTQREANDLSVRLLDENVFIRARVHTINGFSAHADRDELLAWHARVAPQRTFLVHGEMATMQSFAASLPKGAIDLPVAGQSFEI